MPIKIIMPSLSPTMSDGKIGKWLKKEGDKIKAGDILAEIETDKATMEYESTEEGVLGKILTPSGTEGVLVNSLIGVILEDGETEADIQAFIAKFNSSSAVSVSVTAPVVANAVTEEKTVAVVNNSSNSTRVFITPLAKRLAKELNLDVSQLKGSGPRGRIIKHDVENFKASANSSSSVTSNVTHNVAGSFEDKPNTGSRKTIAKRLLESKITVPHYYLTIDCNMDNLLLARENLNKAGTDKYKLSVNDFIIKAVALAMRDVPEANASWMGDVTRYFNTSDVAVAVATEGGLFTPVVRNSETKGLVQISSEMKDLAKRAKLGKLKPEEYQGGGFSISNLGMFGIREFSAIINPPHAGILAVGCTEKRAVVKNNAVVIANVMTVTLSADHRVMDGAVGATFLNAFKKYMEEPINMLV